MIWCDRALIVGPYLCLCITEAQYKRALKHIGVTDYQEPWVSSDATTHTLENNGKTCCIVCLRPREGIDYQQIVSLLVHEAVHVWQMYCESVGEHKPSSEFEAYAIQGIVQQLLYALEELR